MFNSLFGNSENKTVVTPKINWIPLTDLGQLNEIIDVSTEKTVLIFKHSTRCIVSRTTLKNFENEFDLSKKLKTYFLDLLNHRDISNEIANRFNVVHQSPQLLLIKNGKSVYDVSHEAIDTGVLKDLV